MSDMGRGRWQAIAMGRAGGQCGGRSARLLLDPSWPGSTQYAPTLWGADPFSSLGHGSHSHVIPGHRAGDQYRHIAAHGPRHRTGGDGPPDETFAPMGVEPGDDGSGRPAADKSVPMGQDRHRTMRLRRGASVRRVGQKLFILTIDVRQSDAHLRHATTGQAVMYPFPALPPRLSRDVFAELCRSLPDPHDDSAEARDSRDTIAMAAVAALGPADITEALVAVDVVAAQAHARASLQDANRHRADIDKSLRCRAQAASMMRQGQRAMRELRLLQSLRPAEQPDLPEAVAEEVPLPPAAPQPGLRPVRPLVPVMRDAFGYAAVAGMSGRMMPIGAGLSHAATHSIMTRIIETETGIAAARA